MPSAALVLAAQTNGRKSKGPATPEGKRKSAANSRRHGLFSKTIQTGEECERLFHRLHTSFLAEFRPATPFEKSQVETMALSQARYHWALGTSTSLLTGEIESDTTTPDPQIRAHLAWQRVSAAMDRLLRLQSRFDRDYFKALNRLRESQKRNERTESAAQTPESASGKRNERTESPMRPALPAVGRALQPQKINERTESACKSGRRRNPLPPESLRVTSVHGPHRTRAKPSDSVRNRRPVPGILSIYEGR